jgi:hypothetical protein
LVKQAAHHRLGWKIYFSINPFYGNSVINEKIR